MIDHRMTVAVEEMNLIRYYDYAVVNDEIDAACHRIQSIITAEHCRKDRFIADLEASQGSCKRKLERGEGICYIHLLMK